MIRFLLLSVIGLLLLAASVPLSRYHRYVVVLEIIESQVRNDRTSVGPNPPVAEFFSGCTVHPLSIAIQVHQTEEINALLASGLDVNERGRGGMTLLIWSILCRNYDCIKPLLDHGADPSLALTAPAEHRSFYLEDGDNFLSASLRFVRPDLLQLALPYSRNPTHTDRYGRTLIHTYILCRASDYYHDPATSSEEIISKLIAAGININHRSHSGHTALHHTIHCEPCLTIPLLNRGADPLITPNNGVGLPQMLEEIMTRAPNRQSSEYKAIVGRLAAMNLFDPVNLQAIAP